MEATLMRLNEAIALSDIQAGTFERRYDAVVGRLLGSDFVEPKPTGNAGLQLTPAGRAALKAWRASQRL